MLIRYFLIGLLYLGACTKFTAEDTSSTGPSSASGTTGAGGAGGTPNTSVNTVTAGGGEELCNAQFEFPFQLGGMPCQDCADQVACDVLQACDEYDCKFLYDCYRGCLAMHDSPCISDCRSQVSEVVTQTFNEVLGLLAGQCTVPCGFTPDTLCQSQGIPAFTIDCLKSADPCCQPVSLCDSHQECQKCASGIATGNCQNVPEFNSLLTCLTLQTSCVF